MVYFLMYIRNTFLERDDNDDDDDDIQAQT